MLSCFPKLMLSRRPLSRIGVEFAWQAQPSNQGDAANGWQPRFLTFHELPPSTGSDAPPRQPSLILFSLDACNAFR
jgi:hypothetical protein